jgi:hypothetical protein
VDYLFKASIKLGQMSARARVSSHPASKSVQAARNEIFNRAVGGSLPSRPRDVIASAPHSAPLRVLPADANECASREPELTR